jgi:hypothetical protein
VYILFSEAVGKWQTANQPRRTQGDAMKKKTGRRHERKVAANRPLRMVHLNSYTFYVLPADESESGIGCIYTGSEPPDVGAFYSFREDDEMKRVEVKWIKKLATGIYRLGLEYF